MSEAVKSWENSLKFNGSPDQMRAVYHLVASSSKVFAGNSFTHFSPFHSGGKAQPIGHL